MSVLQKVLEFFHIHPHATIKQDDPARPNDFTVHASPDAPAHPDIVIPREHVQTLRMEGALQQHPYHREAYKPVHNVSKSYYDRHFGTTAKAVADEEERRAAARRRDEQDEEDRRRRRRRDEEESSSNVGSNLVAGAVGVGLGMAISHMMDSDHSQSPVSDDNSFSGGGGSFDGGGSSSSSSDFGSSSDSSSSSFDSGSSSGGGDW